MNWKFAALFLFIPLQGYSQDKPYTILFRHDFENDTPGLYRKDQWRKDWNSPPYANGLERIDIITTEDGNKVMQWNFPEGSVGPVMGGGQWEAPFPGKVEVYMSYNIKFKPGFKWVQGGKLPGLGGGPPYGSGTPMKWNEGFSARLMWRFGANAGKIMFYSYHQDNPDIYGAGYPWARYILRTTPEKWYNITIRVVMNTIDPGKLVTDPRHAGNHDGIMEGFINGLLMLSVQGISFRNLPSIHIDKMDITSFFGGSGSEYAAARDEWILLDDVCLFEYTDTLNNPVGNVPSKPGRILSLPNSLPDSPAGANSEAGGNAKTGSFNIPTGLHIIQNSQNQLNIAWDKAPEESPVDHYVIYLNGVRKGISNSASYLVRGLMPHTEYSIAVAASDTRGHESQMSTPLIVTTRGPDTQAPSPPLGLQVTEISETRVDISWKPANDNTKAAGYVIFVNETVVGTSMGTHYSVKGLKPGSTYSIAVSAYDADGNKSEKSEPVTVGTKNDGN